MGSSSSSTDGRVASASPSSRRRCSPWESVAAIAPARAASPTSSSTCRASSGTTPPRASTARDTFFVDYNKDMFALSYHGYSQGTVPNYRQSMV